MIEKLKISSPIFNYLEMSLSPSPTAIPEATKYHHFTPAQVSIFIIIALLIIAGIISLIFCFRFQKKNARRLQINMPDPYRTNKITNLQRYSTNQHNQDEYNLDNIDNLGDIDNEDENNDQNIKNESNDSISSSNSLDNGTIKKSNNSLDDAYNPILKNVEIERPRLKGSVSLPIRALSQPIPHKPKADAANDSNYSLNRGNSSIINLDV